MTIIGHIDPSVSMERKEKIRSLLGSQFHEVCAVFGSKKWQLAIVSQLKKLQAETLDIVCYESFTTYLNADRRNNPFIPFYEEAIDEKLKKMLIARVEGIHWLQKLVLSLFLKSQQKRVFFIFISALAAHRDGGNLFADGLHKRTGSAAFNTGVIDTSHVLEDHEEYYPVEILPGIVKGGYESDTVKESLKVRCCKGKHPFSAAQKKWPEITPKQVAAVSASYLQWGHGDTSALKREEKKCRSLLYAGREPDELIRSRFSDLPDYCSIQGVQLGVLPEPVFQQITRVLLVPKGQLF